MTVNSSNNNQVSAKGRIGAGIGGLATSTAATVTEIGAAVGGYTLFSRGKDIFVSRGGRKAGQKIIPTIGRTLIRNPFVSILTAGALGASAFLEKASSGLFTQSILGKRHNNCKDDCDPGCKTSSNKDKG